MRSTDSHIYYQPASTFPIRHQDHQRQQVFCYWPIKNVNFAAMVAEVEYRKWPYLWNIFDNWIQLVSAWDGSALNEQKTLFLDGFCPTVRGPDSWPWISNL